MDETKKGNEIDGNDANLVKNRSEILFVYDITNANPNGDPVMNRPRMDEDTEINLVSDTRLKRTVRDYLGMMLGEDKIFVKASDNENGKRKTKEQSLKEFFATQNDSGLTSKKSEQMLEHQYIDLRLFGATLPVPKSDGDKKKRSSGRSKAGDNKTDANVDGASATDVKEGTASEDLKTLKWTGPVQFRFGHSLHKVLPMVLKGTSVFPSKEGQEMGTFTEFNYVPYSLIAFSGIVNEENAKATGLTEGDVNWLDDALWNGTKGLITRSKYGQMPRFLMQVIYRDGMHFHIGDLDNAIGLLLPDGKVLDTADINGRLLRKVSEFMIDLTNVVKVLRLNSDRIKEIRIRSDSTATFAIRKEANVDKIGGTDLTNRFKQEIQEITITELSDLK